MLLHWSKMLLLSCVAFLAPIKPLMIGSLVLVALDSLTGVWAAWRSGETITSAKLRRTISKSAIYSVSLIACYVAERDLLGGLVPASKLAAGAIGLVELKSVLENAGRALGQPLFAVLMSKLGSANVTPKDSGGPTP